MTDFGLRAAPTSRLAPSWRLRIPNSRIESQRSLLRRRKRPLRNSTFTNVDNFQISQKAAGSRESSTVMPLRRQSTAASRLTELPHWARSNLCAAGGPAALQRLPWSDSAPGRPDLHAKAVAAPSMAAAAERPVFGASPSLQTSRDAKVGLMRSSCNKPHKRFTEQQRGTVRTVFRH